MTAPTEWLRQTGRIYLGNAAARRDYRVQLRGYRSLALFGIYLAILIGVGYFKYDSIASASTASVAEAQRQLRDFYELTIMMLGGLVSIVTPGLAATAIIMERQRRSLDLIMVAPVSPRYYLVGKTIGVYRYVWMLLVLSLPVTAACVVLGGATWSDVLVVYGLLSLHGLLFAAVGLLISAIAPKVVSAIIWSYAAVGTYLWITAAYAFSYSARTSGSTDRFDGSGLNPFSVGLGSNASTSILGLPMPSWALCAIAILIAVRLCLLGAGSILGEGREIVKLRVHWAAITGVTAFALAFWYASYALQNEAPYSVPPAAPLGVGLFWILMPLVLVVPTLTAYGKDGTMRQRPAGTFAWRRAFDGSPAGALPYLALLFALAIGGGLAGTLFGGGGLPQAAFLGYAVYVAGFWGFFWAVTRFASSFNIGLKGARTAFVAAFIAMIVLPVPFFAVYATSRSDQAWQPVWNLYVLQPVLQGRETDAARAFAYGVGMLAMAGGLAIWSERKRILGSAAP